jgi:hypothetical protein
MIDISVARHAQKIQFIPAAKRHIPSGHGKKIRAGASLLRHGVPLASIAFNIAQPPVSIKIRTLELYPKPGRIPQNDIGAYFCDEPDIIAAL